MHTQLRKIIAVSLMLAAGAGFLFAGTHVAFQQTYPVSDVFGVNIDVMSEEVEIALWNRNEFRVTVVSDYGDYPVPRLSGGRLICEDESGGNRHKCLIEIKVPESFYAKSAYGGWSITTKSGAITASKLWGESIAIETMSGAVNLTKCEAQVASIQSISGRITLSQCIVSSLLDLEAISGAVTFDGIAGGIDAETTSGAINISLDRPLSMDCSLETTTGAITLAMPENTGFKFVFDTSTGSVYNAFTGYSGGRTGIDNYGAGYIIVRAETSTGAIRVLRR